MEGIRKRCYTIAGPDGKGKKFCINWYQWPLWYFPAYPRHPGPDPAPLVIVEIEGVKQGLLQDLAILDGIREVSKNLSPDIAQAVREVVAQGVRSVQKQLPSEITTTEEG